MSTLVAVSSRVARPPRERMDNSQARAHRLSQVHRTGVVFRETVGLRRDQPSRRRHAYCCVAVWHILLHHEGGGCDSRLVAHADVAKHGALGTEERLIADLGVAVVLLVRLGT